MRGFWTGKSGKTVESWMSEGKNGGSGRAKRTITAEALVINGSLKHREASDKINLYTADRKEHMVISVLFAIGFFLHIVARVIL